MVRVLRSLLFLGALVTAGASVAQDVGERADLVGGADISLIAVSGYESWTDGLVGKLRFSDDGVYLGRAFVDFDGRLTDTLKASFAVEAYGDDLGNAVDLTEAFLEWRPVPRSANRYRVKVGAFYPRISLENVESGWTNPYLQNSSAINTWVGEELRAFGTELSWSRKPPSLDGRQEFGINAAVFWGNDPAGSLLAWKGWSIHDRQSRFSDKLPLPPLPQIQPGGVFEEQDPYVEPFREIDDSAGYYVNLEWRIANRLLIRAMTYNNEADPTAHDSGQYAWYTEFEHIGLQATLPGGVGLIAQWMDGSTVMGPNLGGGIHPVDVEYDSYFALLTKQWGSHRVSARYDNFGMTQNDSTREDNNPESGHGWTVGYRYQMTDGFALRVEWLSIKTHRCAHVYYRLDPTVTEEQAQLTLQLRF
ncbi:MAG: hypothetical protein GTN98_00825 [Woeseiaceae bacterium]|nr:hypothetical protein [Woeseiaceae bacterium]